MPSQSRAGQCVIDAPRVAPAGARSQSRPGPSPRQEPAERPSHKSRPTLSPRPAYTLIAAAIGMCLFASVTPSPLYETYAAVWHFSSTTLTLIYAAYAVGVLASLLLAGRASDQAGRRPVLLGGVALLMASVVLFMFANSAAWLFICRGLQGLATGVVLSTASATLLDLHPRRDSASVGLANGVASAAGLGLGILVSSVAVQFGAAPHVLPYLVLLALLAVVFIGVCRLPEPIADRAPFRLSPQRPHIPAAVRHPFLLAGLATLASWSIGGLFFSLGPALAAHLFSTSNVVVTGLGAVALGLAGALAQLTFRHTTPWLGVSAGSIALALGSILIVVATATDSGPAFLVASIIGGVGFGIAFLGGLRQLSVVIPDEHRAGTMSAFYVVAYLSLSVPAVVAGVVVTHLGLEATFEIFASIVAAVALLVAFEAWRTRPAVRPDRTAGPMAPGGSAGL